MIISREGIHHMLMEGLVSEKDVNTDLINPASLDVRLGDTIMIHDGNRMVKSWIDSNECNLLTVYLRGYNQYEIAGLNESEGYYVLMPGEFVLAHTKEYFYIPLDVAAQFQLKSRLGRIGLEHQMAGWIDPGFSGSITLELVNNANYPIAIKEGQRIGQLIFHKLDKSLSREQGYTGHYSNCSSVSAAVLAKDSTV